MSPESIESDVTDRVWVVVYPAYYEGGYDTSIDSVWTNEADAEARKASIGALTVYECPLNKPNLY